MRVKGPKNFDVVVVGELNVDLILQDIDTFPELGKEKVAKNMLLTMGSASAILASNIARLGLKVCFIGKLGPDSFGKIVMDTLGERRVDCSGIIIDDKVKTGITVSMTFPQNYAMVTYMGAMAKFSLEEIDFDYVSQANHLHFSSFYIQPALRPGCTELFRRAKEIGLTTSLDPGWDPDEEWDTDIYAVLDNVDVFLPNEKEAMNISKRKTVEEALETVNQHQHGAVTVIKKGDKGAIAKAGNQILKTKTFNVEPQDTTGAGDSFNAGFLSKWLQGKDLKECLIAGNACGAIAVTKLGGTTASPTSEEIERFLETHQEDIFYE